MSAIVRYFGRAIQDEAILLKQIKLGKTRLNLYKYMVQTYGDAKQITSAEGYAWKMLRAVVGGKMRENEVPPANVAWNMNCNKRWGQGILK